ncbi:hypothetical protein [Nocardioides insulae]|uniref:hypothetical protein n=1 Tax=Nocardioides insulae TaxID=394734 RepID=UPI00042443AC|nr:hypothetical protein [Nocardioides insulae]
MTNSAHSWRRRPVALALAATAALALSACTSEDAADSSPEDEATSSASSAPAYDTSARAQAATWISGQLADNGIMHNAQFDTDDYSLTVDTALGLIATEEQPETVRTIGTALAEHVQDYISPGFGTVVSAGSTAKLAVMVQESGQDPASYGGQDLISVLEQHTLDQGPAAGRIQDELDPKQKDAADWSNTLGQAYAVSALSGAGSAEAAAATDFLLAQQCDEGWFRVTFATDAAAEQQGCQDDAAAVPDVDATAVAVRALLALDDEEAAGAAEDAVAWLVEQQEDDGSFAGGTPPAANANSTGLAGWALGDAGQSEAASAAAVWVSEHQAGFAFCGGEGTSGAIAYDQAAAEAALKGITDETASQFRLATAQAMPALGWLPEGTEPMSC